MTEIERFALDYLPVIIFLGIGAIISSLFIVLNYALAPSNPDPEKNSAYECGFNAFDDDGNLTQDRTKALLGGLVEALLKRT